MPFRFRLATLLRLRSSLEQAEERKLEALVEQAAWVRRQSTQVEEERRRRQVGVRDNLRAGLRGSEIQFVAECDREFEKLLHRLEEEYRQRMERVAEQRERLLGARREREKLETIEKKQAAVYRAEQARREQQERDETSSMCWFRKTTG
jgi:flagellar export protein FliJ